MGLDTQNLIGKASKHDIYSQWGVLLLPKYTQITRMHVDRLIQHKIILRRSDLTDHQPNQYYKMVDDAVHQVKEIFDEVRLTTKIPLSDLQKQVIPVISEVTHGSQLIDLFVSLQAKDDYTYRHNIAVGALANLIGKWLGLNQKDILQLSTAGLLHDIGKMRVPEKILNKPGRLTDEEFELMKKHTVFGYEIIKGTIGTNHRQALVALQHHERMDGSGYPFGITKDKIDLFSRIVAVADVFHAMTSKRAYRDPSPFYEVLYQMDKDTFGSLDPSITRLFIKKIMNSLIGNKVQLTDGRQGTIIMIHKNDLMHPLVQVGREYVDLREDASIHIEKLFKEDPANLT